MSGTCRASPSACPCSWPCSWGLCWHRRVVSALEGSLRAHADPERLCVPLPTKGFTSVCCGVPGKSENSAPHLGDCTLTVNTANCTANAYVIECVAMLPIAASFSRAARRAGHYPLPLPHAMQPMLCDTDPILQSETLQMHSLKLTLPPLIGKMLRVVMLRLHL